MNRRITFHFSTWIIIAFFVLDILFVVLHFFYGIDNNLLNLNAEKNIPTLYQGLKHIAVSSIIAAILTIIFATERSSWFQRLFLVPYWFVFAYLGLDEIGQIHERFFEGILKQIARSTITNYQDHFTSAGFIASPWLAFFIPIMILVIVYLIYLAIYLHKEKATHVYLFVFAICCFALVPVFEYASNIPGILILRDLSIFQNLVIALEEYTEMLGVTLFLTFNILLLRDKVEKVRQSFS